MPNRQVPLAIATCRDLPDWEVDDLPFHSALRARGIHFAHIAWDCSLTEWSDFKLVLIRTTWDYTDRCEAFQEWADRVATGTQLINPPQVVRWNTDKHYLRDLEQQGNRLVPTAWLEQGSTVDIEQQMRRLGGNKGFIKPIVGATARETLRFELTADGIACAQAHCARLLPTESLMLQPYQSSVETEGELSVLFFDGEPSHAVRKIPVPGDYRVQDDFGATDQPEPLSADLVESSRKAMHSAEKILDLQPGDLLYGRVDYLLDGQGNLCLNELELVEPSLFFRHDPESPDRLARAVQRRLG